MHIFLWITYPIDKIGAQMERYSTCRIEAIYKEGFQWNQCNGRVLLHEVMLFKRQINTHTHTQEMHPPMALTYINKSYID